MEYYLDILLNSFYFNMIRFELGLILLCLDNCRDGGASGAGGTAALPLFGRFTKGCPTSFMSCHTT